MQRTLHTARRARARLAVRDVVNRAGRWMVAGAGVGVACVVAEKVVGLPGAWWVWVAVPVGVAGVAAAVREIVRPRPLLDSAAIVDEQLGLKDRLGTALAFNSAGAESDPFVRLAIEESEAVALSVDATKAVPIRFGTSWWTWPTVAAAATAGALWLPESSILRAKEQRREHDAAALKEQTRAADEIREAVRVVEPPTPALPPDTGADTAPDPVAAKRLEALAKLEEELRAGKIDADAAREEGARTLEQAAAELEERSEEAQRTADATRDRLTALAAPPGEEEGALTRAMRQGDMRAAREAARELMERADELTPEERARAIEDMRRLADELAARDPEVSGESPVNDGAPEDGSPSDEPADGPEGGGEDRSPPGEMDPALRDDLREQGLSEQQARHVGDSKSEEEARRSLEELGLPPEAAEKLSKRIAEEAQRREAAEAARERTEDLSRSLRDAAEQMEKPEPPERPRTSSPRPPQPARDPAVPEQGKEREDPRPASEHSPPREGTPGQSGSPASPEQQGDPNAAKPGATRGTPGERGESQPGERSPDGASQGREQGAERREGGEQRDSSRPGEQAEKGPASNGEKTPGSQPGSSPSGQRPQPGMPGSDGEPPTNDGTTPNLDDLPSPDSAQGRALKKVIDNLRKMEQEQQGAARDRQSAQELRDRARKMLENATPEQRRKLEQWAKEFAKENPTSSPEGQQGPTDQQLPGQSRGQGQGEPGDATGVQPTSVQPTGANERRGETPGAGEGERRGGEGLGDRPGSEPGANRREAVPPPAPGEFRTDAVDARPDGDAPSRDGGRVGGEIPGGGDAGAPMLSKQEAIEAARRAQQSAERAIDDRTIPGRFDKLLRRYFKRLPERIEESKE